jgi:hypothetical protein
MNKYISVINPHDLNCGWFTKVLNDHVIDVRVTDFKVESVGTGQLGETRRYTFKYDGSDAKNAPSTLVGKFPSDDITASKSGKDMGFYRAEVMFYRELAERSKINTPYAYVADIDDDNNFILLLEDFSPAKAGDQMSGITIEDTCLALKEAAKLHSAFWNDTEIMEHEWLYVPTGAQGFYTKELVDTSWKYFKNTYSSKLDSDVIKVCDKFYQNHSEWNKPRDFPKCLTHNDFRADNMLFGGERVGIVDWQTSNFLGAGMDVAYFLGGIDSDIRRNHEQDWLRIYYDELIVNGVTDYSFNQLMNNYRHYSFAQIVVAVAATVIVKRTERGDRLFMNMVTQAATQAMDNNALDIFAS